MSWRGILSLSLVLLCLLCRLLLLSAVESALFCLLCRQLLSLLWNLAALSLFLLCRRGIRLWVSFESSRPLSERNPPLSHFWVLSSFVGEESAFESTLSLVVLCRRGIRLWVTFESCRPLSERNSPLSQVWVMSSFVGEESAFESYLALSLIVFCWRRNLLCWFYEYWVLLSLLLMLEVMSAGLLWFSFLGFFLFFLFFYMSNGSWPPIGSCAGSIGEEDAVELARDLSRCFWRCSKFWSCRNSSSESWLNVV